MTTNNQGKTINFLFFGVVKVLKPKNTKCWLGYKEIGSHPHLQA